MTQIKEIRDLAEMLNTQATQLQTIVHAQLKREGSLMTQAQMSEAIMLIGELTIATTGLAIGQLVATIQNTPSALDD